MRVLSQPQLNSNLTLVGCEVKMGLNKYAVEPLNMLWNLHR